MIEAEAYSALTRARRPFGNRSASIDQAAGVALDSPMATPMRATVSMP